MISSDNSIDSLVNLGKEAKEYANLQKDYLTLDLTEKLTKVLSGIILGFIIVCFGLLVLFYLSFMLIFLLAPVLGSTPAAFALVSVLLVGGLAYVFFKRNELIIKPVTKMITDALLSDVKKESLNEGTGVTLAQITKQKKELETKINQMQDGLTTQAQGLFKTQEESMAKWEQTTSLIGKAMAIYDGVRFGLKMMNRFKGFVKKKR